MGGTQKVLLIGIASHADRYGDNAWPSIDTLAKYAHVTPRAVQMALNDLVKAGLLFKAVNEGGSRQTAPHMRPNLYRLSMAKVVQPDPLKPTSPPEASFTTPLKPASPHPLKPASPEQSIEPSLNSPNTHTTGKGAGEGESAGVCVDLQVDQPIDATVSQTLPGMVCKAMKAEGIADPNPGHAKLLALLQAGADLTEFTSAAAEAVQRNKGFAYALGMVANRRKEAAAMAASGMHQGALPASQQRNTEPAWRTEQRSRMQQACPRIAAKGPATVGAFDPSTTIDVEAHHVPAIALG